MNSLWESWVNLDKTKTILSHTQSHSFLFLVSYQCQTTNSNCNMKMTLLLLVILLTLMSTRRCQRQSSARRTKVKLGRALEMIEMYGMKTCVARAICELACNPNIFGRMGRSLYGLMTSLNARRNIKGVPEEKASFYRTAVATGTTFKDKNKDCQDSCTIEYTPCNKPTPFLLRMASNIDFSI